MDFAGRRHALWALAVVSFIESSVFPIPPDVLLIPMVLAARNKAWVSAAVCTVSSVLGGLAGYLVGYLAFEWLGGPLLAFYGYGTKFAEFRSTYDQWGAWAVFIAGVTPFPYKVITILSGTLSLDPVVFTVASVFARGVRFFLIAALLWRFGEPIRAFIERRLGWLFTLAVIALLGGFAALKLLV